MGTKVEGKSYLPEYFAMGDLNVSSNSSWPQFYKDKAQNGHLYNDFALRPTHGYLAYNKEILKQTMLEQEAIFRKQVCELHRLYRIQKDLMEQFNKNETCGHSRIVFASQSYSFSSHVASEGMTRIWQIPALGHDGSKSTNFPKEGSAQSSPTVAPLQDSNPKFSKKMLDLHLPADVYIDNEDTLGIKNTADSSSKPFDPLARIHSTDLRNDVQLTLGASEDTKYKENPFGERVADLNKPIADLCDEEILRASVCIDFVGVKKYTIRNQWPHSSTRSDPDFLGLSWEPFKEWDAHEGTASNLFGTNEEEMTQKSSFCHKESSKDTSNVNFFPPPCYDHGSFEPAVMRFKKSADTPLPDYNNALTWLGQNPMASPLTEHHLENSGAATRPVSAWLETRNGPNCIPSAAQAPPCNLSAPILHEKFCDLIVDNTSTDGQKWKNNDINVIQAFPVKIRNGHTVLDDKCEESLVGISWFKKRGCNAPVDLNKSHMALGSTECHSWIAKESENMKDFASDFHANTFGTRRNEVMEDTAARLLGFPVADGIHKSATCSLVPPERFVGSDRQMQTGGEIALPIGNFIDLNDAMPCTDNPKSSEVSSGQSGYSLSKPIPSIDSEASVFQEEDAAVLLQECVLSAKLDGLQERECSPDSSVIAAAEIIVALSMDKAREVLLWFAEVVTPNEDDCGIARDSENRGDADMDVFESMTLKLEETKIEEKCFRTKVTAHKSGEDYAPSLLLSQLRRGRARRRRQRRDFQKDILPGLASLSRNEVTEDLQTLGGLMMKTSGTAWQSASMRRASCNGAQAKGKRRQRRSLAVAVAEIHASPVADGRSMIGWGRKTRRCRRQRCPPGNTSVHLT